jgi:hypothetical protein
MPVKSAGGQRAIFRQVCELIPSHLVPKLARKHGVQSRDITPSFRKGVGKGVGPIIYNLDARGGLCEGKTWQENHESWYDGAVYHVMSRGDRGEAIFWKEPFGPPEKAGVLAKGRMGLR